MSKKFIYYILIAILILVVIFGILFLNSNKKTDASKFKKEFEQYNSDYLKIELSNNNPFVYTSFDKVNKFMDSSVVAIYIGNPKDDNSRLIADILDDLANDNSVSKIYYLDYNSLTDKNKTKLAKKLEITDTDITMPLVIYVNNGVIIDYYIYSDDIDKINAKNELNYSMQKTFNDFCDEACDD